MTDLFDRKTYRADIDQQPPAWGKDGTVYDLVPKLTKRELADGHAANLISSEMTGEPGHHRPVLDIDFAARLIPSSTPGHFHLYLDGLDLEWVDYRRLLDALAAAGVIQEGYANASIERKATFVRKPGIKKGAGLPTLLRRAAGPPLDDEPF